jgi:hypothetical protein
MDARRGAWPRRVAESISDSDNDFFIMVVWCTGLIFSIELGCKSCYRTIKQNLDDIGDHALED